MSEVTEREAIKGLQESLKEAAGVVIQLSEPDIFPKSSSRFIKAMSHAGAYSNILGHYTQKTDFFRTRDMIESLSAQVAELATARYFNRNTIKLNGSGNTFGIIQKTLLDIAEVAKGISESKPLTKTEIENSLVAREAYNRGLN